MSKAPKKRSCPAERREMTPAECGEGRNSRFACPPDCGFNPFASANYSQLLQLEQEVDGQALAFLARDTPDRAALEREVHEARRPSASSHALHSLLVWKIYLEKGADGLTCAQRWERAGFPGLKNDAKVLMRAKMGIRIALIEIHRVLDTERTEGVDLLSAEPRPLIVMDRGLASVASRFATGLTWVYALPHYHRLFGSAILLQEVQGREPREVVDEIVRHLGGPLDEAGMRLWLAENFVRFESALQAVAIERRRLTFASIDAKFGKSVYELKARFTVCRELLDEVVEVDEDTLNDGERHEGFADARVWFARKTDAAILPPSVTAEPVLGRVLLGQSHWRLEAMGAERLAVLRQRFEAHMGDRVQFLGEQLDDMTKSITEKAPRIDPSLVPPRLLENPQVIHMTTSRVAVPLGNKSRADLKAELFANRDKDYLDTPIPALDGRTPREAARDPALRPKLVTLMKSRVRECDQENLNTGSNQDVNWMLRELGLDEIIFDPPPSGRQPRAFTRASKDADDFDDEDNIDEDVYDNEDDMAKPMDSSLPPAPPLPDRPFTMEEVVERLRAALEPFETAAAALDALVDSGCTLIDDVNNVTTELLDDNCFATVVLPLANTWFIFVPPGTRGHNLTRAGLQFAIHRETLEFLEILKLKSPAALERYFESGPQPALTQCIIDMAMRAASLMPKKQRPKEDQLPLVGPILRAVITELDRVHRSV